MSNYYPGRISLGAALLTSGMIRGADSSVRERVEITPATRARLQRHQAMNVFLAIIAAGLGYYLIGFGAIWVIGLRIPPSATLSYWTLLLVAGPILLSQAARWLWSGRQAIAWRVTGAVLTLILVASIGASGLVPRREGTEVQYLLHQALILLGGALMVSGGLLFWDQARDLITGGLFRAPSQEAQLRESGFYDAITQFVLSLIQDAPTVQFTDPRLQISVGGQKHTLLPGESIPPPPHQAESGSATYAVPGWTQQQEEQITQYFMEQDRDRFEEELSGTTKPRLEMLDPWLVNLVWFAHLVAGDKKNLRYTRKSSKFRLPVPVPSDRDGSPRPVYLSQPTMSRLRTLGSTLPREKGGQGTDGFWELRGQGLTPIVKGPDEIRAYAERLWRAEMGDLPVPRPGEDASRQYYEMYEEAIAANARR